MPGNILRPRLLVSACLAGCPCRYDGAACTAPALKRLAESGLALPVCPEQLGGLPTPRFPAEIKDGGVFSRTGMDLSAQFNQGARETLRLAVELDIGAAIFKERSPSCGCAQIYDGSFSGKIIPGQGITTALLRRHGIQVRPAAGLPELLADSEYFR